MSMKKKNNNGLDRIEILLNALGIDTSSFYSFMQWALSEQLVCYLIQGNKKVHDYFTQRDGLKLFRNNLIYKTKRNWSISDLNKLFEAVKKRTKENFREPIEYSEYLKLLWTAEHKCAKCGRKPPEVKLHIDHIEPVSLGGSSKRPNLQFLCEECNLKKSNKLEGGKPWLDLE